MQIKINGEDLTVIEKIQRIHSEAKDLDHAIAELTPVTEFLYGLHNQLTSPIYDGVQYISGLF